VEPPENDLIISETSIRSFRYLEHQNPSIIDWVIDSWSGRKIRDGRTEEEEEEEDSLRYYVGFLATREAVALLANDVIMPGTLLWSFRHLEHQNPSSNGWDNFLVPFLATREAVVLHANDLIMSGTSIRSFRHLEHQNLSSNGWDNCLVPFLATREAVAPLANDLIMSGTSIRSFRHLKHPNLSTGDDFIYSSGIIFLVPFLATREAVALHANDLIMSGTSIRSFRHLEHQNPSIISEDIGRARSVQQFRRNGTESAYNCLRG